MILVCSSIKLPSPMLMGPPSAMICACKTWTEIQGRLVVPGVSTTRGTLKVHNCHHNTLHYCHHNTLHYCHHNTLHYCHHNTPHCCHHNTLHYCHHNTLHYCHHNTPHCCHRNTLHYWHHNTLHYCHHNTLHYCYHNTLHSCHYNTVHTTLLWMEWTTLFHRSSQLPPYFITLYHTLSLSTTLYHFPPHSITPHHLPLHFITPHLRMHHRPRSDVYLPNKLSLQADCGSISNVDTAQK